MSPSLSQSIFTIEVDRKPVLAFASRKHADAEAICADVRIREKLRALSSGRRPLLDDFGILRVRLARVSERAAYDLQVSARAGESGFVIVYLVELDQAPDTSVVTKLGAP